MPGRKTKRVRNNNSADHKTDLMSFVMNSLQDNVRNEDCTNNGANNDVNDWIDFDTIKNDLGLCFDSLPDVFQELRKDNFRINVAINIKNKKNESDIDSFKIENVWMPKNIFNLSSSSPFVYTSETDAEMRIYLEKFTVSEISRRHLQSMDHNELVDFYKFVKIDEEEISLNQNTIKTFLATLDVMNEKISNINDYQIIDLDIDDQRFTLPKLRDGYICRKLAKLMISEEIDRARDTATLTFVLG